MQISQSGLVAPVLFPQLLAQFGVCFRHGRLAKLTRDHVIVPGVGLVWREGYGRLRGVRFGNGRRGNRVSLGTTASPAGAGLSPGRSDSLIQDFAVQFTEGTLQLVDLAAAALGTVGFVARVLTGGSKWFPDVVTGVLARTSGGPASFVPDLVTDFPAAVRTTGFSPFFVTRGGFQAALAAILFRALTGWRPAAGIAGLAATTGWF